MPENENMGNTTNELLPESIEYVNVSDLSSDIVLATDNAHQMAHKIFYNFKLNQSCTISGWIQFIDIQDVMPKGDYVIKLLEKLDTMVNCNKSRSDGRMRRSRVKLPNTVGGFVAQKIFKWDVRIMDQIPRYTIWRIQ